MGNFIIKNLIAFTLLLVFVAHASGQVGAVKTDKRPNIIFILTDDQPYRYIGALGDTLIKTPNLDKLVQDGVLFTNCHVTSPICTPSRASIFLGQFERKHQINFNSGTSMDGEAWETSYPMALRKNGYYTGYIGKNHVPIGNGGYKSGVIEKSFDYWYGGHEFLGFYPKQRYPIFKGAKSETQPEVLEEGAFDFLDATEYKLEGALHFLSGRPQDKPFNLSICFNLPHDNGTSSMKMLPGDPEIYRTLYRDITIPMVNNYVPRDSIKAPKLPSSVLHAQDRQTIYNYVDNRKDAKERTIRQMQAMTGIDQLVGQLRKKLKELNIDDNTIIIFTSDHGVMMGQYGLGGKALNYEACTRVPLIIYNPLLAKNRQGQKYNMLVQTIDLAPTMLSMASAVPQESYQGKDLTDILTGKEKKIRDYLFTENLWSTFYGNPRIETVQNEEWKYLRYYKNENISSSYAMKVAKEFSVPQIPFVVHDEGMGVYRSYVEAPFNGEKPVYEELYHLTTDPEEAVNLAANKKNAALMEKMRVICDKMVKEARGTGKPHVLRYTAESKEEFDGKERKSTETSKASKTNNRQDD